MIVAASDGTVLSQGRGTLAPGARTVVVDVGDVAPAGGDIVVRTRIKPKGEGAVLTDTASVAAASLASAAPLLWRRGPSTQMRFVADGRHRGSPAPIACAPTCWWPTPRPRSPRCCSTAWARPSRCPSRRESRADGALTWGTAELALAPLAPSEYVLKITVTGPGGPSDVYTGIRVVP